MNSFVWLQVLSFWKWEKGFYNLLTKKAKQSIVSSVWWLEQEESIGTIDRRQGEINDKMDRRRTNLQMRKWLSYSKTDHHSRPK